MKKTLLVPTGLFLLFLFFSTPALAATFFDDFNDGNTNGWWFGPSLKEPLVFGNWHVEDGVLLQDVGGDGFNSLIENLYLSNQTVETRLNPLARLDMMELSFGFRTTRILYGLTFILVLEDW